MPPTVIDVLREREDGGGHDHHYRNNIIFGSLSLNHSRATVTLNLMLNLTLNLSRATVTLNLCFGSGPGVDLICHATELAVIRFPNFPGSPLQAPLMWLKRFSGNTPLAPRASPREGMQHTLPAWCLRIRCLMETPLYASGTRQHSNFRCVSTAFRPGVRLQL